jgi:hypothetical protein
MSPKAPAVVLERLLLNNGLGWLIDEQTNPGQATQLVPKLLERLEQVETKYLERIGVTVHFSPEALETEATQNPHKVRAFLQAMRVSTSPDMLVMVWRILQGLSIHSVDLKYREGQEFSLTVILARAEGAQEQDREEYRSRNIFDARLIRHFGYGIICDQPLFEGFYPFPIRDDGR